MSRLLAWLTETPCRSRGDELLGSAVFWALALASWSLWRWLA